MKEEKSCIICAYGDDVGASGARKCKCLAEQWIHNPQADYCDFFKKIALKKGKNITKEVVKDSKRVIKRLKQNIEKATQRIEKQKDYLNKAIEEKELLSNMCNTSKSELEELEKAELGEGEYRDSGKEACYKRIKQVAEEEMERIERTITQVESKIKDIDRHIEEEAGELKGLNKRAKKQKVKLIED